VLEVEQFNFEHVTRGRPLDGDRSRERVDRVEAHVGHVRGRRFEVELAVDSVATLEPDHLARLDRQDGVEAVVEAAVDVRFVVAQMVVDGVACHTVTHAKASQIASQAGNLTPRRTRSRRRCR
jgi:hypothetical protein